MREKLVIKTPFGEEIIDTKDGYSGNEISRIMDIANKHSETSLLLIQGLNEWLQSDMTEDLKEEITNPKEYWAKQELLKQQEKLEIKLSTPAIDILKNCQVEGLVVKLPEGQLERDIYLEVKERLTLIGGVWKGGKVGGFVFKADPTTLLAQISNGEKKNLKKEFQFFGTPSALADRLVKLAEIKEGHSVLEPSAGQGAIIEAIYKAFPYYAKGASDKGGVTIDYYELMPTNDTILGEKIRADVRWSSATSKMGDDFLKQGLGKRNKYDRIIANPPFNKNQDIDHIKMMYEMCKDGGRIVTITSNHWKHSRNKKEIEFKNWLDEIGATHEEIESGAFKESGTSIAACILVIDK